MFLLISYVITTLAVSMPRESVATSTSRKSCNDSSFTVDRMAACIAAPYSCHCIIGTNQRNTIAATTGRQILKCGCMFFYAYMRTKSMLTHACTQATTHTYTYS